MSFSWVSKPCLPLARMQRHCKKSFFNNLNLFPMQVRSLKLKLINFSEKEQNILGTLILSECRMPLIKHHFLGNASSLVICPEIGGFEATSRQNHHCVITDHSSQMTRWQMWEDARRLFATRALPFCRQTPSCAWQLDRLTAGNPFHFVCNLYFS